MTDENVLAEMKSRRDHNRAYLSNWTPLADGVWEAPGSVQVGVVLRMAECARFQPAELLYEASSLADGNWFSAKAENAADALDQLRAFMEERLARGPTL